MSEPETDEVQKPPALGPKSKKKSKPFKARLKKLVSSKIFLGVVLVLLILAPSAYFYQKSQDAERKLNNPSEANRQVVDEIKKKVGRHILLPTDEQPTLVTVTDVSKVKGQTFFANAENGDKALVYTQARKAVLYRPSKDIVIEVAPLNVDAVQPGTTGQQ